MATNNQGSSSDTNTEEKGTDAITGDLRYNEHHKKPVDLWVRSTRARQACHSELATNYADKDRKLNTTSVILSAISSSAVFSTINPTVNSTIGGGIPGGAWTAGFIAVVSTVINAVIKALDYATLAEQHRMAARQCTKLRFRLEIIVGKTPEDDGNLFMDKLTEWTREYEDLLDSAPIIPQDMFVREKELRIRKENEDRLKKIMEDKGVYRMTMSERQVEDDACFSFTCFSVTCCSITCCSANKRKKPFDEEVGYPSTRLDESPEPDETTPLQRSVEDDTNDMDAGTSSVKKGESSPLV